MIAADAGAEVKGDEIAGLQQLVAGPAVGQGGARAGSNDRVEGLFLGAGLLHEVLDLRRQVSLGNAGTYQGEDELEGAVHDVTPDATAFGHRDAKYAMVVAGMWPDPAQNEANTRWVKDYYQGLAPHAQEGGYINFAASDDMNRVRANFGQNYDRLCEVKTKYDSENVFRHNQNISPA